MRKTTVFDATGPLFLSYRQSDGTPIVALLAWRLRAAGIPVWRDKDDLPPGDTADRLEDAIADGLSGAVLIITPDITHSDVVRGIEAPDLIRLDQGDSRFQLLIANDVLMPGAASVDYSAPDRLLGRPRRELQGVDQSAATPEGLDELVKGALWHRMAEHRQLVADAGAVLSLTIQTRNIGQVYDRTGAQLDIRVRPSQHERLPDPQALDDLKRTLGLLPDAVTRTGAQTVQVAGGAHLSVAFALGAALPSSRVGQLEIVDQRNDRWTSTTEAVIPSTPSLEVDKNYYDRAAGSDERPRVAVYVDLLPTRSDAAWDRYLNEKPPTVVASTTIRGIAPGLLDPATAGKIAAEAAAIIRQFSAEQANAPVDLLLRVPFPIAVLLGRLSNTLRVRSYEWDDSAQGGNDFRPRYVPCLEIHASAPHGAITHVLLQRS
ncbi:SAVED domain-containing protein [Rathayibacter sp. VKM Ac-2754]|uniref:SAVED domain-containing protein n=1 Tax=Rathayibacter sp. VKM Ac-2754 TaxID=2609251 RepID=UPI001358D25D|nr:SAVED domain-containing protein [Rathayibacter sp. VKM Ac-2754]MWV57784.1 SAVED domain-containing protein [Rathayibacter sp. VKM Ac-2754]